MNLKINTNFGEVELGLNQLHNEGTDKMRRRIKNCGLYEKHGREFFSEILKKKELILSEHGGKIEEDEQNGLCIFLSTVVVPGRRIEMMGKTRLKLTIGDNEFMPVVSYDPPGVMHSIYKVLGEYYEKGII